VQFSIATKELLALSGACDIADTLLGDEELDDNKQILNALSDLTTTGRQVILVAATDIADMTARFDSQTLDLDKARKDLESLTTLFRAYRGMLEKIVRMKTAAGGRNTEAAMAAESFLAQNPVLAL
jgi:hypothetical protein